MKFKIERFDKKLIMFRTNKNLQNEIMKMKIDRIMSKKKMCFFECEKNNDRKTQHHVTFNNQFILNLMYEIFTTQ